MKKWSQYLEENQQVLNEFNKKDEEAVMADEENFTVAFEIELESEGYDEDDMYEAEQEARREAAENYFGYDAEEYFRSDVYDNLTPDEVGMEEPDDGAEMVEWYYNNTSTNPSQLEIIYIALAYQGEPEAEDVFDEAIDKVLNEPMPFLKMVYGDSTRIAELQDLLGWSDDQMTMGFEVEGGKQYPEPIEKIGASRDAMLKIIDYYLINLRSLSGRGGPGNIFPTSKKPVDMEKFVNTFSSQNQQWFAEQAHEALDSDIDDLKSRRYGYDVIQTIVDEINSSNIKYWSQKIMARYRNEVEEKADEAVQSRYEEFTYDPIQWLEDMGYEEYQWFDEDNFRDNYTGGGSSYGCDVYELERAMEDNFPNFMSKYQNTLKFEEDGSLSCGIEFSQDNPPYLIGLNAAIEYLEDFFDEYDNQSVLRMTQSTGLHTNIGYSQDGELSESYNLFKALMFLNHTYATKGVGFPSRERSGWTGDLKKPALHHIEKFAEQLPEDSSHEDVLTKKSLMKKYLSREFDELSGILSNQVSKTARSMGSKSIGFNVNYTANLNYIEFRYPGKEDATLESMTKALKYYAFIVKAAADPTFKQKEYIKDLVGFLNNLKGEPESVANIGFTKEIKKGDLIISHNSYQNNFKKILIYNMIQATELKPDPNPEVEASWNEQDRERIHARRAKSAITILVNSLSDGFIETLINNTLPAYYAGLVRRKTGPSVRLSGMSFDDEMPMGVDFYNKNLSVKAFQFDLDDRNYTLGKNRGDDDVKAINKMVELLKSSNSSVEFIQKLIKESGLTGDEDPVKRMDLVLRKNDGEVSDTTVQKVEDEALTDELVDLVYSTTNMNTNMSEDKELNEIRNHFKKWKF
tara:strand:+ start:91 stop:2664 length:2574 start_codon:yes stop_codon:yes gene_type:complete